MAGLIKYMPWGDALDQSRQYANDIMQIVTEADGPIELDAVLEEVARKHNTYVSEVRHGLPHIYRDVEIKPQSDLIWLRKTR